MAHFFAPDQRTDGYDLDRKLAPDSVWRMRILTKQRRLIGLWGGQHLNIRSNSPAVVPNDGFGETASRADGIRMLSLLGQTVGAAILETRMGASQWCSLQVVVLDVDTSSNPVKDDREFSLPWSITGTDAPLSGSIPVAVAASAGIGMASVVRIPVPGTNGLAVELKPRGWTPKGGSTSTVFIQDVSGKRHLRLDYGYNVKSKTVDYHWNQKGTANTFGISDHTTVGKLGQNLYHAAKYLRWGGRVLMVVGVAADVVSIVQASRPLRRATQAVAGWAGAWAGCKVVGTAGAYAGTFVEPGLGTAIGAVGGCIIGGAAGYYAASGTAGIVYDWAEETIFTPLPQTSRP
jgi:hypothetical protein